MKKWILLLMTAGYACLTFSQQSNEEKGLFTGKPSLYIPLIDQFAKVGLSYEGFGGIKKDEVASNVGLGWRLHAGAAIKREVKDLPDDLYEEQESQGTDKVTRIGFLRNPSAQAVVDLAAKIKFTGDGTANQTLVKDLTTGEKSLLDLIARRQIDGKPDYFYLPSGESFYIDPISKAILFSTVTEVKVSPKYVVGDFISIEVESLLPQPQHSNDHPLVNVYMGLGANPTVATVKSRLEQFMGIEDIISVRLDYIDYGNTLQIYYTTLQQIPNPNKNVIVGFSVQQLDGSQ